MSSYSTLRLVQPESGSVASSSTRLFIVTLIGWRKSCYQDTSAPPSSSHSSFAGLSSSSPGKEEGIDSFCLLSFPCLMLRVNWWIGDVLQYLHSSLRLIQITNQFVKEHHLLCKVTSYVFRLSKCLVDWIIPHQHHWCVNYRVPWM